MLFCGLFYGLTVANVYKSSAAHLIEDSFLTKVGMAGSMCNGGSRVIWSTIYDYVGFKKVYGVLLVLQLIAASVIYSAISKETEYLYFAVVSLSFLCEGGHFALFPPITVYVFGSKSGGQILSFVFWNAAATGLTSSLLLKFGLSTQTIYYLASSMTVINMFSLYHFKEEPMKKKRQQPEFSKLENPANELR